MEMPPECMYQPVQMEEELQDYLNQIEDPEKRREEERRLRRLRRIYLEWQEAAARRMQQIMEEL